MILLSNLRCVVLGFAKISEIFKFNSFFTSVLQTQIKICSVVFVFDISFKDQDQNLYVSCFTFAIIHKLRIWFVFVDELNVLFLYLGFTSWQFEQLSTFFLIPIPIKAFSIALGFVPNFDQF